MAVISLSIVESEDQIVSGIPRILTVTANNSATIFYTLDGTIPTLYSTIYTGPILLPTNSVSVVFNVFASNGIDQSPIYTETYITNIINNTRLSHASTDANSGDLGPDLFPFGSQPIQPNGQYTNNSGITVDDPTLAQIPSGFDGHGNTAGFTNNPFDTTNYQIIYTTKDSIGQQGDNIGNLPAEVKIKMEQAPPEETEFYSKLFNPKAMVIFQDYDSEDPTMPVQLNKPLFSYQDPTRDDDGSLLFNSGLDSPPLSGSLVRSFYNDRTQKMTSYYFDSWSLKWVISSQNYTPSGITNLSQMPINTRSKGSRFVYEWIPFTRRVLF